MPSPSSVIVIGTSAGGMPALTRLIEQLTADLPAAVLVVQHMAPESSGEHLAGRLHQHSNFRCKVAQHQEPLEAATLYLAPPDRHLLVKEDVVLVTKGPRENGYRPAADALFRSAAVAFGPNVVGVVLTGMLHDGTAGLDFIKRCGGVAVVQDPADAEYPSMPESALRNVEVDYVLPIDMMGRVLAELVGAPHPQQPGSGPIPRDLHVEAAIAERVVGNIEEVRKLGMQVPLTCPDCGGALWELEHGNVLRYRCHTGHAFTAEALLEKSQNAMEETLWVALRMMEERKNLLSSMATHGTSAWNVQQNEKLEEIKQHVNRMREFLLSGQAQEAPRPDGSGEDQRPADR